MRKSKVDSNGDTPRNAAAQALSNKWNTQNPASGGARWDWKGVDGNALWLLIAEVGERKGAVMVGCDRQGVGGTLSIWLGGEKVLNKWYTPSEVGYQLFDENVREFVEDLRTF